MGWMMGRKSRSSIIIFIHSILLIPGNLSYFIEVGGRRRRSEKLQAEGRKERCDASFLRFHSWLRDGCWGPHTSGLPC
ncbi:hypothetical protein HOY80DRAFT_95832 [Tuber brumale]|nr:hypothetical protein HOY80DRAFT_95832 [Tuber brumale]